jgi:hypothetical protein
MCSGAFGGDSAVERIDRNFQLHSSRHSLQKSRRQGEMLHPPARKESSYGMRLGMVLKIGGGVSPAKCDVLGCSRSHLVSSHHSTFSESFSEGDES